jgi:hypothetical protein
MSDQNKCRPPSWREYCRHDGRTYDQLTPAELMHSEEEARGDELLAQYDANSEADNSDDEPVIYTERQFHSRERRRNELTAAYGQVSIQSELDLACRQVAWCEAFLWARRLRFWAIDIDIMQMRRGGMTYREISDELGSLERLKLGLAPVELTSRHVRRRYDACVTTLNQQPLFGLFTVLAIEVRRSARSVIDVCFHRD